MFVWVCHLKRGQGGQSANHFGASFPSSSRCLDWFLKKKKKRVRQEDFVLFWDFVWSFLTEGLYKLTSSFKQATAESQASFQFVWGPLGLSRTVCLPLALLVKLRFQVILRFLRISCASNRRYVDPPHWFAESFGFLFVCFLLLLNVKGCVAHQ